ncbi:hypothetical protein AgCh_036080 [Apium graveolens]
MKHEEDSSGTGSKMEVKSIDNAPSGKLCLEGSSRNFTLLELPRDHGLMKIFCLIICDSVDDALCSLELSSDLPTVFFVPLRFGCIVDGNAYVVVEKFKRDSFPVPKDKRRTAVRQMIELLIYLELNGVLHARLEPEKLVNVADKQHDQICQSIDFIVGEEAAADDDYKKFREELLKSRTVVDIHSLLYHPYVTSEKVLSMYYASCGLDLCYTQLDHASNFSDKFKDRDWKAIVTASGSKSMVVMLESMVVYVVPRLYQNTAYDKHQFIWHIFSEDHDEKFKSQCYTARFVKLKKVDGLPILVAKMIAEAKFGCFYTMVEHVKNIFPDYVDEMWKYMHDFGLNAHFSPEDYGFSLLEHAKSIIEKKNDTNIYIASLLKACKMCCLMLAYVFISFNVYLKENFILFVKWAKKVLVEAYYAEELNFAATEFEYCIKVCFGLNIHLQVINRSSTGETIAEAVKSTNEDLEKFCNSDLTTEQLTHLRTPDKWPEIDHVCRIVE